ncbi:hypothetical protein PV701_09215 [Streptomyces stelliscabiei]|nr:hypothetical protein [Streptomyces stelliscabiei]MDX3435738.1 hypothetical protein [Streptomyces stelliscabiei]MDX3621963.1 hypothetical protein [Streptomyces stelliscabiei]
MVVVTSDCQRAAEVDRLRLGRGLGRLLLEAFVGCLAAEPAVRAMVVGVVLPIALIVVGDLAVIDDDAVEEPVELLDVDAV